jgi:hypothetical protein
VFRVSAFGACIALLGCSAAGEVTPGKGADVGDSPAPTASLAQSELSDSELLALADKYLNLKTDKAGIAAIDSQIRALSPAQAHKLGKFALDAGHPDEKARALSETALDYAESKGISFLDLTKTDGREIMAKFLGVPVDSVPVDDTGKEVTRLPDAPSGVGVSREAACSIGYVACGWTSAWNSYVTFANCSGGCTAGTGSDRTGNSACELLDCDYRMWFPRASASTIVGSTSAANCILGWYGALSKYSTGGYTYIGYGIAGPAYCGFYPPNPALYFVLK